MYRIKYQAEPHTKPVTWRYLFDTYEDAEAEVLKQGGPRIHHKYTIFQEDFTHEELWQRGYDDRAKYQKGWPKDNIKPYSTNAVYMGGYDAGAKADNDA